MLDEFMAMMEKKYFRNSALLGVFTDIPSGWRLMNGSKRMGLFQPGERLKCPVTGSLDDLTDLQNKWNVNWRDSGIRVLISPMVTYLNDGVSCDLVSTGFDLVVEIRYLRAAHNEISTRFQAVPRHKSVPESTKVRSVDW
jgi:hypothetical protein